MADKTGDNGGLNPLWIVAGVLLLLMLCACVLALATLVGGLGIGTLAILEADSQLSIPTQVFEVPTVPPLEVPTATSIPGPAGAPTATVDAAYQSASEFGGNWEGSWRNLTFGSSGALRAQIDVSPGGELAMEIDFDGPVFGTVDPPAKTFRGSYDGEGALFEASGDPLFGDLTIEVDEAGEISIVGEMVPVEGVASFTASGRLSAERIELDYIVAFPGGAEAEGVIDLTKASAAPGQRPVAAFIEQFETSLQQGDIDFLLERLHPAVIERYGESACRDHLQGVVDPNFGYTVLAVSEQSEWDYARDGQSTLIPNAIAVEAQLTTNGQVQETTAHYAEVDGVLRWFTDCGDPLAP